MMGYVISPQLFVLVMEMILHIAEVSTNEITGPSTKAFIDDKSQITHGTTGDSPTIALQMDCDKMPQFINN